MSEFSKEWINKWRFLNDPILDTHCVSSKLFERALLKIETQNERIAELEAHNKDFHLACINALDLHRESDVPKLKDIPNIIEEIRERNQKLEIQLKSKDIIINNQQGRLNYYATKDLLGEKNEQ